jgi:hypothetical protein
MLVKTGDAEIIGVIDQAEINDDNKRKDALANALVKAKERISGAKVPEIQEENKTEN